MGGSGTRRRARLDFHGARRLPPWKSSGKGGAVPYEAYDIATDEGWVSVGIDHDTAAYARGGIRRWWRRTGRKRYPAAKRLLITAD